MTRRLLLALALVVGTWGFSPAVPQAVACPMCKAANDEHDARPRAYMVSIIFMLEYFNIHRNTNWCIQVAK